MARFEREIEKYEVFYGNGLKREFQTVEHAIQFATEQEDKGLNPEIKEINVLVGWY